MITDDRMTRFMTLDQSVDLIQHALEYGESGDVVMQLISCKIIDLIEIFSKNTINQLKEGNYDQVKNY